MWRCSAADTRGWTSGCATLVATEELSIGDYVLSGGELPALVVVDAVSRLVPGVVGDSRSVEEDSFSRGLLDYPHYTRPAEFSGREGARRADVGPPRRGPAVAEEDGDSADARAPAGTAGRGGAGRRGAGAAGRDSEGTGDGTMTAMELVEKSQMTTAART